MTLFVRHPIRNIGKINSYERRVSKYKEGEDFKKFKQEKKKKSKKE